MTLENEKNYGFLSFLALTPYDGGMLIITGLSNVSPLEVLKYSFYIFSLLIVTSVNIYFNKNKKVLNNGLSAKK